MNHTFKYYKHSKLGCRAGAVCALLSGLLGSGCAGPNQTAKGAQRLAYADLNGSARQSALQKLTELPVVLHFEQGERVPVDLQLDSSLLELAPTPLELVAKRDFYLLLRPDGGPLVSADGVDFESDGKNYFSFGFAVQRDRPTLMRVRLGVRPDPARAAPGR